MTTDRIEFLVEHLPHINSTSVFLHGARNPVVVSQTSSQLVIKDDLGDSTCIQLPVEVDVTGSNKFMGLHQDGLLLRLKPRSKHGLGSGRVNQGRNVIMSLPDGKWTKKQLLESHNFSLKCLKCHSDIIDVQNCLKLNEMPSEFWMELMDYWHCHKPDEGDSGITYSTRYNSLKPAVNEILIGASFFLAQKETFADRIVAKEGLLQCQSCLAPLGEETKDSLCKIYKWSLCLVREGKEVDYFPAQQDVVFTLLNLIKGNSTRHVLLRCGDLRLFVWIFAVGIDVTLGNNCILKNCMKILYRSELPLDRVKKQNIDEAHAKPLPMECFVRLLEDVHNILPAGAKEIDSWKVSYVSITH